MGILIDMDIKHFISGIQTINWGNVLTAILGIYGAILTTYTIYKQRKDKKPNVKTSISMGFMTGGFGASELFLFVKAANHGETPVVLSSWQLILPHKRQLIYPNANGQSHLPFALEQNRNYQVWVPVKVIARSLNKYGYKNKINIKAVYFDELENKYISKDFKFDIKEWLKE